MQNKHLSLIIPCYNESKNIVKTLKEYHRSLTKKFGHNFELIAVNDGSQDDTYTQLLKAEKVLHQLQIISYEGNKGKGYAIKQGMQNAKGAVMGYLDADNEINIQYIIKYYNYLIQNKEDIVIGSKAYKKSKSKECIKRKYISQLSQFFIQKILKIKTKDTQVGAKVFRREVAKNIIENIQSNGFIFDLEFITLCEILQYNIKELPVKFKKVERKSSVNLKKIIICAIEVIELRRKTGSKKLENYA